MVPVAHGFFKGVLSKIYEGSGKLLFQAEVNLVEKLQPSLVREVRSNVVPWGLCGVWNHGFPGSLIIH